MINYILQGAIFITAIFLMFMIIRPTSKGGAQISLLIAGLLLYGVNSTLGKIEDESNLILWGIFAIIFVALALLFFTDKKIEENLLVKTPEYSIDLKENDEKIAVPFFLHKDLSNKMSSFKHDSDILYMRVVKNEKE